MLLETLQRYWGYDGFRPLQEQAMQCALNGRDSLVIMPTGGGKSLCFQAPAMCLPGIAIVVSPLISLMKDQVDALKTCGIAAEFINSSMSAEDRLRVATEIRAERIKLLYVSPERLVQDKTIDFLKGLKISLFAIDEAHCVSEWGHDFRVEYRQLRVLRTSFPEIGIHAYTATATERVREDIVASLELRDPELLVGSFDRPNLIYKAERRSKGLAQVGEVLDRHRGESGIIYCTTRNDVDKLHQALNELGMKTLPYHAGLPDHERRKNQEAFIEERVDIIVATVAFGMGIDKSNVRFVLHYGMPKSLENYQQESGRAGRDGLEADCTLLYSGAEFIRWKSTLDELPSDGARQAATQSLEAMSRFCTGAICRHRVLVNYFGQDLPSGQAESCGACDVCLGQLDLVPDPMVLAQKILSSVVRQGERFAMTHTARVLKGSKEKYVLQFGHDKLSTYGLLAAEDQKTICDWIEQLVGQGFLKKAGDYHDLKVTPEGWALLKGNATPRLIQPATATKTKTQAAVIEDSWEGVDKPLFELLRDLRRTKADELAVPAYIVFTDTALRDMARRRPVTLDGFRHVKGVGEKKLADFGEIFITCIAEYCREHNIASDILVPDAPIKSAPKPARPLSDSLDGPSASAIGSFRFFRERKSVAEVAAIMNRAVSTVGGYLTEFIRHEQITDPTPWVEATLVKQIEDAALEEGLDRLRPIFDRFTGAVSYEQIRPVIECLRVRMQSTPEP
ncbi:MAG: DNA helicase RecQ [Planctomycetia bacterium]|nr:DNA helicase RecQ [Planctomycetia bacterium]